SRWRGGRRSARRRRGRKVADFGLRISDCGFEGRASNPQSAIANPQSLSRRPSPPRIEIVLQQDRGGERVDVLLAAAGRAPQLADRLEHARRGHPLVRQREADAALAPIHCQQPPFCGHPWAIVAKKSLFVLVRFMRSSRNSIASTGGMSERKLRSR